MGGKRYITICIPGRLDDCSDAVWFVYDRTALRSVMQCEDRSAAAECAKLANHADR